MKRKELEVGKEYLQTTNNSFKESMYGNEKVRIIDTGHWEKERYYYSSFRTSGAHTVDTESGSKCIPKTIRRMNKPTAGSMVLVEYLTQNTWRSGGSDRFDVVQLRTIRGLWDELVPSIKQREEEHMKYWQHQREEQDRLKARKGDVVSKFKSFGLEPYVSYNADHYAAFTEADTDLLISMLDELNNYRFDRL